MRRTCNGCEYYHMGMPYSCCLYPKGRMQIVSDYMCFFDAGEDCPLSQIVENKIRPVCLINILKKKFVEEGIKGAVVGISGGKDSTVVAKLMTEVLGKENVLGVLMPNGEQTDISDSYKVVKLLDIPYIEVNINSAFTSLMLSINNVFSENVSQEASMNIAPRLRMTVLYAVAQSKGSGWRVIGTTNKSEEYIGWLTKWGDGAADFEPIIDYTVSEVKVLGENLGLPMELIDKVPADGLANGSDEDRLGFTYDMLDSYILYGTSGYPEVDEKIERLHRYSIHKRNPTPSVSF